MGFTVGIRRWHQTARRTILLTLLGLLLAAGCTPSVAPPTATLTPTLTPVPTDTATPLPSATPRPTATPLPTLTPTGGALPTPTPFSQLDLEEGMPPPFDITLPEGWQQGFTILPVDDGVTQNNVPVAIYSGPVPEQPGITAWIVVLWGFPSLSTSPEPDFWADGLRFLRGTLLDTSCNIGTDLSRFFTVGSRHDAVGTYFSAVGCTGEPDTAGWFAGLQEQGGNYVFYVYTEPLEGFDIAAANLQRILDTVSWQTLPTLTPAP